MFTIEHLIFDEDERDLDTFTDVLIELEDLMLEAPRIGFGAHLHLNQRS